MLCETIIKRRTRKEGMKILEMFLITAAVVIAACQTIQQQPLPQPNVTAECSSDSDCGAGGCSGQVCTTAKEATGLITTCECREEYGCLKMTSCGCVEGKCRWTETADYAACIEGIKTKAI